MIWGNVLSSYYHKAKVVKEDKNYLMLPKLLKKIKQFIIILIYMIH